MSKVKKLLLLAIVLAFVASAVAKKLKCVPNDPIDYESFLEEIESFVANVEEFLAPKKSLPGNQKSLDDFSSPAQEVDVEQAKQNINEIKTQINVIKAEALKTTNGKISSILSEKLLLFIASIQRALEFLSRVIPISPCKLCPATIQNNFKRIRAKVDLKIKQINDAQKHSQLPNPETERLNLDLQKSVKNNLRLFPSCNQCLNVTKLENDINSLPGIISARFQQCRDEICVTLNENELLVLVRQKHPELLNSIKALNNILNLSTFDYAAKMINFSIRHDELMKEFQVLDKPNQDNKKYWNFCGCKQQMQVPPNPLINATLLDANYRDATDNFYQNHPRVKNMATQCKNCSIVNPKTFDDLVPDYTPITISYNRRTNVIRYTWQNSSFTLTDSIALAGTVCVECSKIIHDEYDYNANPCNFCPSGMKIELNRINVELNEVQKLFKAARTYLEVPESRFFKLRDDFENFTINQIPLYPTCEECLNVTLLTENYLPFQYEMYDLIHYCLADVCYSYALEYVVSWGKEVLAKLEKLIKVTPKLSDVEYSVELKELASERNRVKAGLDDFSTESASYCGCPNFKKDSYKVVEDFDKTFSDFLASNPNIRRL